VDGPLHPIKFNPALMRFTTGVYFELYDEIGIRRKFELEIRSKGLLGQEDGRKFSLYQHNRALIIMRVLN